MVSSKPRGVSLLLSITILLMVTRYSRGGGLLGSILGSQDERQFHIAANNPFRSRSQAHFSLMFEYGTRAPDNYVQDSVILINGQFPGPPIHVKIGETFVIEVINKLDHGISLHFHGIRNFGYPDSDGAPDVTQENIPPGHSFEYVVSVTSQSGTFIYHLHNGLDSVWAFGPLIVEDVGLLLPFKKYVYDYEHIFILSQCWHNRTSELEKGLKGVPFKDLPETNSILINGRSFAYWNEEGKNGLTRGYETVYVIPRRTYRFRVIGFGTDSILSFSIENHKMRIIEVDGIITRPIEVDRLEVNSGQRYSVLVTMDQEISNYWIKSEMIPGPGPQNGRAIIHYDRASDPTPKRKMVFEGKTERKSLDMESWEWSLDLQPNRKVRQPDVYPLPKIVDREIVIRSGQQVLPNGTTLYDINGKFYVSPQVPYLHQVRDNAVNISREPQVYHSETNKVLQLVFQNVASNEGKCEQHPWHVHGHSFYIVGHGSGEYNATQDAPKIQEWLKQRRGRAVLRDVVTVCPSVAGGMSNVTPIAMTNVKNVSNVTPMTMTSVAGDMSNVTPTTMTSVAPDMSNVTPTTMTSVQDASTVMPMANESSTLNRTKRGISLAGDDDSSGGSDSREYRRHYHPRHSHGHRMELSEEDSSYRRRPDSDESGGVEEDFHGTEHSSMKHSLLLEGLPPGSGCGWVAVRFVTDNPGVWLVHCHLTAHLIMGKKFVLYSYNKRDPRFLRYPHNG